ncbi:CarD family transcriptional regulator [Scrofimicrobium sp. R131]|uniref:CarD family transcriptional regulator n=1 Tax=Scrofimicrobium appendicitidis TaxID=3079930 RepID=A0AAU7V6E9_9ACTO
MTFKVGETVVYPHHGAATIEEIITRELNGEPTTYLVLRIHQPEQQDKQKELIIQVPADKVDEVGVRDVVDDKGVEEVLDVLRAKDVEEPSNWSRRYKANQEKITSGDIVRVSEVVRDLSRRDADKGLSTGEKRMLTTARQILISELALARDIDEEKAGERLDEVLSEAGPDEAAE